MTHKQAEIIREALRDRIKQCHTMSIDTAEDYPLLSEAHLISMEAYEATLVAFDALFNTTREEDIII